MSQKTIEFLNRLGIPSEDGLALIENKDEINLDQLAEKVRKKVWSELSEHPDHGVALKTAERGEQNRKWLEQMVKGFELPPEIKEGKHSPEEVIKLAAEKHAQKIKERYMADPGNDLVKQLNIEKEKADKYEAELRKLKEEEIPKIKMEVLEDKRIGRLYNKALRRLESLPSIMPVKAREEAIMEPAWRALTAKYKVEESSELEGGIRILTQDGNTALTGGATPVPLTIDTYLREYMRERDLHLETGDTPTPETKAQPKQATLQEAARRLPHAEAAERALADMRKSPRLP